MNPINFNKYCTMSHQLGRVVSELLHRYFGEIVQLVGNDLFRYGSKPISAIIKSTGLIRSKVVESLRTLIKFDLVSFEPGSNDVIADYKLIAENVLLLIRYPRYLLQIKSKFGSEAELIIEEFLQNGTITATKLLVSIAKKYKDDKEKNTTIKTLKDIFVSLATAGFVQQAPVAEIKDGDVPVLVAVATIVPDLDVRTLMTAVDDQSVEDSDNVYWKVNYDRFHQDFRDDIMVQAMVRRIDENAGEVMGHLLSQMYLHSGSWEPSSNPIATLDLKQCCRRAPYEQFLDHYLRVIEESGSKFVRRSGDAAGGQFILNMRQAAQEIVYSLLEHTITERRGDKAARIFRLIREKKYIEEDDIQKHAMLPNKECKELTYKLLEEHFISVQPMRKSATGGVIVKAAYLYHINLHEVANSAQQMCYRSLNNILKRSSHERKLHTRLLEKQRRVRSIVHGMRVRGEPQINIDDVEETITPPERALLQSVEKRLKHLSAAEIELDKSLFILQWYFMYKAQ